MTDSLSGSRPEAEPASACVPGSWALVLTALSLSDEIAAVANAPLALGHRARRAGGRVGPPVKNTTEEDQVTFWLVVYAVVAVSLLVFAIAHHVRYS